MMKDTGKERLHQVSAGSKRRDQQSGRLITRRNFLRATAVFTGGALSARSGYPMPEGHGQHGLADHQAMDMTEDYHSMMFTPGHNMEPGMTIEPPGAPRDDEVKYKEFSIEVKIARHEILPGIQVHMFVFNGQVPGPEFNVTEGDWIKVNFTNKTEEMHTIHWHGLAVPYTMDGVPMITQDPVHPGQTFVYRFQAKPAGTRWYHCHWGTPLHASTGMHGAFIIQRRNEHLKERFPYEREYTLVLESWDVDFAREEMNGLLEGMKQVNLLMAKGMLDPMTHGFFKTYQAFLEAYRNDDYVPPYLQGRSNRIPFRPNFFGINGKSYPATRRIGIKQGEWIRLRLISASSQSHHMHLHGHDFWWVAQDGNDLPDPRHINTIHVEPGGTYDIMIYGDNPGYWTFHDHKTTQARNNGIYPGGALTLLEYEDFEPSYVPAVSVDQ